MGEYAEVIAGLEAATAPSRDLDTDIMELVASDIELRHVSNYTNSIDASLLLLPKSTETVKFGATVWVYPNGRGEARIWCRVRDDAAEDGWAIGNVLGNPGLPANIGATPAIALCIAALKARRTELESHPDLSP